MTVLFTVPLPSEIPDLLLLTSREEHQSEQDTIPTGETQEQNMIPMIAATNEEEEDPDDTAQPPAKTCQDDKNHNTFTVEGLGEQKDCEWLQQNMEHFDHLCKFLDVAYLCPVACGACHYFFED